MAKVKGTNKRTRPKRSYKKPGSKKGRGVRQTWKPGKNNFPACFLPLNFLKIISIYIKISNFIKIKHNKGNFPLKSF